MYSRRPRDRLRSPPRQKRYVANTVLSPKPTPGGHWHLNVSPSAAAGGFAGAGTPGQVTAMLLAGVAGSCTQVPLNDPGGTTMGGPSSLTVHPGLVSTPTRNGGAPPWGMGPAAGFSPIVQTAGVAGVGVPVAYVTGRCSACCGDSTGRGSRSGRGGQAWQPALMTRTLMHSKWRRRFVRRIFLIVVSLVVEQLTLQRARRPVIAVDYTA